MPDASSAIERLRYLVRIPGIQNANVRLIIESSWRSSCLAVERSWQETGLWLRGYEGVCLRTMNRFPGKERFKLGATYFTTQELPDRGSMFLSYFLGAERTFECRCSWCAGADRIVPQAGGLQIQ